FGLGDELRGLVWRIERVGGDDGQPGFGQSLFHFVSDALDSRTARDEAIGLTAFGTIVGRRSLVAAMVAGEPATEAMFDQPGAAVRALEAESAVPAQRERRVAAAVEEQQRLLASRQPFLHGRHQS